MPDTTQLGIASSGSMPGCVSYSDKTGRPACRRTNNTCMPARETTQ